jgi:hypothetical protein
MLNAKPHRSLNSILTDWKIYGRILEKVSMRKSLKLVLRNISRSIDCNEDCYNV